jgi:hypothetical protein
MAQFVEESAGDDDPVDTACGKSGRCVKRLHDHASRSDGVADHDDDAGADDGRDEYKKELESDAQKQTKTADVDLTGLTAQEVKASRMLIFQMLRLDLQQVRLWSFARTLAWQSISEIPLCK